MSAPIGHRLPGGWTTGRARKKKGRRMSTLRRRDEGGRRLEGAGWSAAERRRRVRESGRGATTDLVATAAGAMACSNNNARPNELRFFTNEQLHEYLEEKSLFLAFYASFGLSESVTKLAAAALNKRNWRYHWLYMKWFRRLEYPTELNEEFEMGTYVYFDRKTETLHKKIGFTFEYKYLGYQ